MADNGRRVVLITGASSGIGRACADYLHRQGFRVYGTSRQAPTPPTDRGDGEQGSFALIKMDVNQEDSVEAAVAEIMAEAGRIDVVVNNSGIGVAGAVEDTSLAEAQAQMDTNFFGALRVCRAVLPIMRTQRAGTIVNVSSIAGRIGIPFQALYSASKFALEGMTEALRMEVKPYGIRVVLIEPGDFKTGFTANRRKVAASGPGSVYQERFLNSLRVMEADEMGGAEPEQVARQLERIILSRSPRLRYAVGPLFERVAIHLKKVVPARFFEWALMTYYKID